VWRLPPRRRARAFAAPLSFSADSSNGPSRRSGAAAPHKLLTIIGLLLALRQIQESHAATDKKPDSQRTRHARSAIGAILQDGEEAITIEASTGGGGGYLVLTDSFDGSCRVEADRHPPPLLRANGLYRAVPLQPGWHMVRFMYKPVLLYACALVSGGAAAALWSMWRLRHGSVVASTSAQTAS
jgi:hypothetical protein